MTGDSISLGPGREFDAIRALVRQLGDVAVGIGDDAAVLDVPAGERLVVSVDTSVEEVHFRRGWLTPREIGYRAAAAAVSDLAAMAARPLAMLVVLSIPPSWRDEILEIGQGIGDCARAFGLPIVGGDTSRSGELSIAVTVLGSAARPLGRGGARAGDAVYVSGRFGGPRRALERLLRGEQPDAADRERFARPVPRIAQASWLAEHGATAAIDISDGLASDVGHLAAASNVEIELDLDRVPLVAGATAREAVSGGEEYELAVTAPATLDTDALVQAYGVLITRVGEVRSAAGEPRVRAREGGRFVDLIPGYDHFSA